jgi:hypothetical protein
VPMLAAAIGAGALLLVTHNVGHVRSGHGVHAMRPRTFIEEYFAAAGSLLGWRSFPDRVQPCVTCQVVLTDVGFTSAR